MNTLLLDRAQSFVHLAHPTSSYPATNGWAWNLNRKFHNEKCFHMFPLKPLAHISVDAFEETWPPSQARGFGQWKPRLMFCPTIMPQSQSFHTLYNTGLPHSYRPQLQAKDSTKFFCSTVFLPSSLATSRWHWHYKALCPPGTVRSAVPHWDWRWSFP